MKRNVVVKSENIIQSLSLLGSYTVKSVENSQIAMLFNCVLQLLD